MKWENYPNLRKKPPAPAKNRGRVQRAIKRAFIASGAEVLASSEIYSWTHPRLRLGRRKTMPFGIYWGTLQVLRRICDPVVRRRSLVHCIFDFHGRPPLLKLVYQPRFPSPFDYTTDRFLWHGPQRHRFQEFFLSRSGPMA